MEKFHSNKLWNFFKNTKFIISHIVSSQPIPQAKVFYIDETNNAKASFWSLKKYKVSYTKFHSAQQNKLYTLIQVICLHPYPINIVWFLIFSFCIKKYKNLYYKLQSTYYSTTLKKLQSIIKNCTSPNYITHTQTHSYLPRPMTMVIKRLINLFLLLLQKTICSVTQQCWLPTPAIKTPIPPG